MKKNITRILSIVMAASVLFALSGCGKAKNADSASAQENEAAAKSAVAQRSSPGDGKKVYFASPLFNVAEREYNLKLVHLLERYGYEVFLPQRDGYLAPDLQNMTEEEKTKKIFDKDESEVLKADIVFMLLDGRAPDEGACVELGIGYATGKRCYGFKTDARSVEYGMDINPMITSCFVKLFYNLDGDALFTELEEYLKANPL